MPATESLLTPQSRVAVDFLRAWTRGDEAAALAQCHPDLVFQGPIERREGAGVQVAALLNVAKDVESLDIEKVVADGPEVVIIYHLTLRSTGHTASIAESNIVVNESIVRLSAYFDTYPLRKHP